MTNKEWAERKLRIVLRREIEDESTWDNTPRPPHLFGYIRCSHQDSMDSGLGIDGQHRLITAWGNFLRVQYPELPEVTWIEEEKAISAYKVPLTRRPGGKLLNRSLQNGDHVVFAFLNRAWRNTEDCLSTVRKWESRGVIVHFANLHISTNTAQGKLLLTIMAACAEMDSTMKSEQTKAAMAYFPSVGRMRNGHAPMGFKLIGQRGMRRAAVPDPEARRIMGEIVRIRDARKCSWRDVSDYVSEWIDNHKDEIKNKSLHRWSVDRCQRAYNVELELQDAARKKDAG